MRLYYNYDLMYMTSKNMPYIMTYEQGNKSSEPVILYYFIVLYILFIMFLFSFLAKRFAS